MPRKDDFKLTQVQADVVVKSIQLGVPHKFACVQAGLDRATFYRWMAIAEKAKELPGPRPAGIQKLCDFYDQVKAAEAKSVLNAIGTVQRAAAERDEVTKTVAEKVDADGKAYTETTTVTRKVFNWQAAAWLLERRHPEEFARKYKMEHSQGPSAAEQGRLEEAKRKAVAKELEHIFPDMAKGKRKGQKVIDVKGERVG